MRIVYLIPDLLGPAVGISRYGRMVLKALAEADAEVHVLAMHDDPGALLFDTATGRGTTYVAAGGSRIRFVVSAMLQALRGRPKLIIAGHPNFTPLAWLLARLTGARLVTFIYGIDVWTRLPAARRLGLQHSDRILSISRHTAERAVVANQIAPRKVRILHNCLDPHLLPGEVAITAPAQLNLLTVARMSTTEQYKGHEYVIRALATLLCKHPQLVYHVIGDGDDRPRLGQLSRDLGVAEAVVFHGRVSEEALPDHYRQATIFVMPSRAEGFGFVFIEAMAHGVPAIGGNVDATPEVIVDGVTGFTVDPTSEEELATAIEHLLLDAELRERMGRAAREHVLSRFSYEAFADTFWSYLREPDLLLPP